MKGYRTVVFNLLVATAPVFDFVLNNGEGVSRLVQDPELAGRVLFVIGIINVALRALTSSPIFKGKQ